MGLNLEYTFGQTPLDEDEKEGLLIESITSRGELDEFEQLNIEKAVEWSISTKLKKEKILTEEFIKLVHKKMLGEVWSWAGKFRKSNKNIGIEWIFIGVELKKLLDDTEFWIENKTYDIDEIAIRFKHRLVKIHCFPNGNGRHSRIMADILIEAISDNGAFDWKSSNLVKPDSTRKEYISAIQKADNEDIQPLMDFARSKT